jgi:hypothetical protein
LFCIQVIIRLEVGVPGFEKARFEKTSLRTPGLRKSLLLVIALLPASLTWLSCGGGGSAPAPKTSGIAYRALITNNVAAGSASPGVFIVNAAADLRGNVAPISAGNNPGLMVVTPNLAQTLVFSGNGLPTSDNQFTIINNTSETATGHVNLPGMTESFVVSPDSTTAYVAVPTAPVVGGSPGVVEVIAVSGSVEGEVNVPSVQYVAIGNTGNRVLAFSQGTDSIANTISVITPSNIGIPNATVAIPVCCFDHPVAAFFSSDDSTAYLLNCGPECGGTQAGIQTLDLTTNPPTPGIAFPVPGGATVALLINSSTMYIAGTPYTPGGGPSLNCPSGTTQAQYCGQLTIVNLSPPMSVVNTAPIIITDGYHDQMAFAPNGQLFIGSHTCTEIIPPSPPPTGAEIRGCLSIYNTLTTAIGSAPAGGVLIPPETGDVTGLQPIAKRKEGIAQEVIYVVQGRGVANQGGTLYIYDTTIDALEYNPNNTNNPGEIFGLVGNFVDVKTVDF